MLIIPKKKVKISEIEAIKKYPNCKFVMSDVTEDIHGYTGVLEAVSTESNSFTEMMKYFYSIKDIGFPFISGHYGTISLCGGKYTFNKEDIINE